MAIHTAVFVATCAALVASCSAGILATGTTISNELKQGGAQGFVFNPTLSSNGTQTSPGGSVSKRMVGQWPQLMGQGISQTLFTLDPCSMRPAHVHPRAAGLLYVVSGSNLIVGFVTEDGTPVVNQVSTGASAVFPQGLVHYQQNLDCYQATYTISYNSEDPGTQMTYLSFLDLPDAAVAATLGVNSTSFQALRASTPKGTFLPNSNADCLARCKALGSAQAPAPQLSAASLDIPSSAGRKLI